MRDRFANRNDHVGGASSKAVETDAVKPIPPKAPPAGLDPVKWATLSRPERRALARHHRKVTGQR